MLRFYKTSLSAHLLFCSIFLSACGSGDKKQQDPTPQYVVRVKLIATDAGGLGAGGEIRITRQNDYQAGLLLGTLLPDNGEVDAPVVTNLKTGERVNIGLAFRNATTGSGIVPRTTSKLRGEIWVNDQLKGVAELDRNTPSQNPDYPTNFVKYDMGD